MRQSDAGYSHALELEGFTVLLISTVHLVHTFPPICLYACPIEDPESLPAVPTPKERPWPGGIAIRRRGVTLITHLNICPSIVIVASGREPVNPIKMYKLATRYMATQYNIHNKLVLGCHRKKKEKAHYARSTYINTQPTLLS